MNYDYFECMSALTSSHIRIMPRQIIIALLGAIAGLIIHIYLLLSEEYILVEIELPALLGAMLVGVIVAFISLFISDQLKSQLSWEDNAGARLLMSILLYATVANFCYYIYYKAVWPSVVTDHIGEPSFSIISGAKLIILIVVLALIISILNYALYSYRSVAQAQINRIQLKREIVDLQMETLRSQLRPHFLFNSLNTISSLMHSNKNEAELFIRRLAQIYNYTLDNYSKKAISLNDELSLVVSYVEMMRARFGNHITLVTDIPHDTLDKRILPLSLQSLVENAMKHNVVNDEHQLTISIMGSEDIVRVENNKTVAPAIVESNHIGLSNLQKRYRLWDNHKVSIYNHEHSFAVTIPIE